MPSDVNSVPGFLQPDESIFRRDVKRKGFNRQKTHQTLPGAPEPWSPPARAAKTSLKRAAAPPPRPAPPLHGSLAGLSRHYPAHLGGAWLTRRLLGSRASEGCARSCRYGPFFLTPPFQALWRQSRVSRDHFLAVGPRRAFPPRSVQCDAWAPLPDAGKIATDIVSPLRDSFPYSLIPHLSSLFSLPPVFLILQLLCSKKEEICQSRLTAKFY